MNIWECNSAGCDKTVHGCGSAVGLRAIGWFFLAQSGGSPAIYCPAHRPDGIPCHEDIPLKLRKEKCPECAGLKEAQGIQASLGYAPLPEVKVTLKPTLGRIVLVRSSRAADGDPDARWVPAIVTAVQEDNSARMDLMTGFFCWEFPAGVERFVRLAEEGACWIWPPRTPGYQWSGK